MDRNFRRYCTARLRRLYKSLKFTHGRGKYTKKAITAPTVTEVRCVFRYLACRTFSLNEGGVFWNICYTFTHCNYSKLGWMKLFIDNAKLRRPC